MTTGEPTRPLASWRYRGTLRKYQQDVLDRVPVEPGDPVHVVAPPGAGKTLLGLLLAARHGARALALAPTATIRAQWARSAAALDGDVTVSEDPRAPGDLTALTYQMLSVLETGTPLADLAVEQWRRELVEGGRDEDAASHWVEELRTTNPTAYRKGIARRSRTIRRRLAAEDPELLAAALHPSARALVDRLVDHGVETIVLDECHHLLDHWALVVAYTAARIRAAGREPVLIGLTATLPSTDDRDAYDTYTALLGDVDHEVPTPAVVKEGNLAPYRDLVWFVEPTPDEIGFLRTHEERLAALVRSALDTPEGTAWIERTLQPDPDGTTVEGSDTGGPDPVRLARAFDDDFAVAESAARMLAELRPAHPLLTLLPDATRTPPDTEQRLRLLARYALDEVLPDPARAEQWQRIKRSIVDFGFTLTDRGVRRGRDPIDTLLASSAAKDHAVGDVLRLELDQDTADRLRAVVVTDHAVHGNTRGRDAVAAGALRTHATVVARADLAALRPVLVTAQHLRIAARDQAVLLPAIRRHLGTPCTTEPVDGVPDLLTVDTTGAGSAAVVAAVSALLTEGTVRVVVGTRGLLGEGWDCPAANTLVDLTAVATSSATQQLRGRTLRLDPAWPRKVAHNWTVTAVVPAHVDLRAAPDVARMHRKHEQVWGLLRDDDAQVARGTGIALTSEQRAVLDRITAGAEHDRTATVDVLDEVIARDLPSRADSWTAWRIGEPYADRESTAAVIADPVPQPFRTGPTAEILMTAVLGMVLWVVGQGLRAAADAWRQSLVGGALVTLLVVGLAVAAAWPLARHLGTALRQRLTTADAYRRALRAVVDALHRAGRVPAYGEGDVRVAATMHGRVPVAFSLEVLGGSTADRRTVTAALAELFGPVRTPRFLLQVGRVAGRRSRRAPLLALVLGIARTVDRRDRFLAVPSAIGRRRADAEVFAEQWNRTVGPAVLHEIGSPESLVLLVRARRASGAAEHPPTLRDQWS